MSRKCNKRCELNKNGVRHVAIQSKVDMGVRESGSPETTMRVVGCARRTTTNICPQLVMEREERKAMVTYVNFHFTFNPIV